MRTLRRLILILVIALVVVGAGGIYLMRTSGTVHDAVVNEVVNASDLTGKFDAMLRDNDQRIADLTGMDVTMVDNVIDDLDIANWEATTLPDDAVEFGTNTFSYAGQDIVVTTYENPSYVTLGYRGQQVTFAVSESAEPYIGMLSLLGAVQ